MHLRESAQGGLCACVSISTPSPFLTFSHHLSLPLSSLQVTAIGTGSPPPAVSNEGLDVLLPPGPFLPKPNPLEESTTHPPGVSPRVAAATRSLRLSQARDASSHEQLHPLTVS